MVLGTDPRDLFTSILENMYIEKNTMLLFYYTFYWGFIKNMKKLKK